MTNYESTVYTVEDEEQDTSAAFSTVPTKNDPTLNEAGAAVMKLWHSTTLPDGQSINVSVEFELADVRGLQSFLNDQYGRGQARIGAHRPVDAEGTVSEYNESPESAESIDYYPNSELPKFEPPKPGDLLHIQVGDETFTRVVGPDGSKLLDHGVVSVPIEASEYAQQQAAESAVRQCPHISNGVQCTYAEHANTPHSYETPGRPDWQAHQDAQPIFPRETPAPEAVCERTDVHHHMQDSTGVHWVHDGTEEECPLPDNHYPVNVVHQTGDGTDPGPGFSPEDTSDLIAEDVAKPAKKSNRRKKEEIAYDRALEAFRAQPTSQLEYVELTKAAETLRKRFPDAERLVAYDLHVQHQDTGYLTNPDFAANYREAAQEAAQIEEQQAGPRFAPELPVDQPTPFVPPIPGTPALPMPAPEQQSTEELQAAAAFPCQHRSEVSGRQCTRPAGHELADPPKPHIYGELQPGQTLPVPSFIPPFQPETSVSVQPGFTVSPVTQGEGFAQSTIPPFQIPQPTQSAAGQPSATVLSFQVPPTPEVQGAELQPPAPAAPPWGGQQ